MTFTISSITLTGFGTDQPAVGGSPAITNYDGSTLYCHITPNDTSTVDIVFNQTAPNEYIGEGQIEQRYAQLPTGRLVAVHDVDVAVADRLVSGRHAQTISGL